MLIILEFFEFRSLTSLRGIGRGGGGGFSKKEEWRSDSRDLGQGT